MRLWDKFRPTTLESFIGQRHLLSPNSPLVRLLMSQKLSHSFFFGPTGCGKTTFARIVANAMELEFYELNATSLKVEEIRAIVARHKGTLLKPLIFVDEVHRLSKTQQEVLLPIMEKNEALILGASTENPMFSLAGGIRSRSQVFEFKKHTREDLHTLLERVGYSVDEEAKNYLLTSSNGDARAMLNLLDNFTADEPITLEKLKFFRPNSLNDAVASDDVHYDLASAMIKSVRGSDPDAAIYYLARLIKGGESPEFIARRLMILASEDIGNANPNAMLMANACLQSVAKIGYPEARIILAQTAIYLASSPKSNSAYNAINSALQAIENGLDLPIPPYLKDSHTMGSAKGYLYPHDFGGWVKQKYLTKELKFVEFKPIAQEARLFEWLDKIRQSEQKTP